MTEFNSLLISFVDGNVSKNINYILTHSEFMTWHGRGGHGIAKAFSGEGENWSAPIATKSFIITKLFRGLYHQFMPFIKSIKIQLFFMTI